MQSTAFYYVQLANALYQAGIKVSVENQIAVSVTQMHLSRIKTDKSDFKAICEYRYKEQDARRRDFEHPFPIFYRSLKRDLKHLKKEIKAIELRLLKLVKEDQQEQLTLLKSIPDMGEKTALFLIVSTDGFAKFERAGQL